MRAMWCRYLQWFGLLVVLFHAAEARRWLPHFGQYRWRARVNRPTGLAASKETSKVPSRSNLQGRLQATPDPQLLTLWTKLVIDYPQWLCSAPVTVGLLQAKISKRGTQIQTRIGGWTLLEFGRTTGSRVTYRQGDVDTSQCTVEMPILGGCLALPVPNGACGGLLFTIRKNRAVRETEEEEGTEVSTDCTGELTTGLANYRSPIMGACVPTMWIRKYAYLATQSLIHAGIMWRFHRHLWSCESKQPADKPIPKKTEP